MDRSDALDTMSNDDLIEELKEDLSSLIIKLSEVMGVYTQSSGDVSTVISETQVAVGNANQGLEGTNEAMGMIVNLIENFVIDDGGNDGGDQGGNDGTDQGGNDGTDQGGNDGTDDGGNDGSDEGGNDGSDDGGNDGGDDGVIDPDLPLSDWLDALAQTVEKVQCARRGTTVEEALQIVEAYSSDGLRIAVLNLCENMDDYEIRIDGS